jgi:predicted DNA-binding transcriptional regulator AlpA
MPKPEPSRRLLTSAETREQLGIGTTKFYLLVASGELAVVRIPSPTGKRQELRIEQSEIDAFIARNRERAGRA